MRVFAKKDITWKNNKLYLSNKKSGYQLSEHPMYPGLFYVETPIGNSGSYYNESWAKQHALALLNLDQRNIGQQTALGAPLVSLNC